MGISTKCGIMIGLPFEEFLSALPEGDNSYDEFTEMIDNSNLDIGSVYYDSPPDENIVGKWLTQPSGVQEIVEEDYEKFYEISEELSKMFPNILFKMYITNDVT